MGQCKCGQYVMYSKICRRCYKNKKMKDNISGTSQDLIDKEDL